MMGPDCRSDIAPTSIRESNVTNAICGNRLTEKDGRINICCAGVANPDLRLRIPGEGNTSGPLMRRRQWR